MMGVDDFLNGALAGPMIAPPMGSGNSTLTAYGAGNQSSTNSLVGTNRAKGSSSLAMLIWIMLIVLLVLSHTFTFSLQR